MARSNGRQAWLGATVALFFALALTWGLLRFGAAETEVLYKLFLLAAVPGVMALISPPLGGRIDWRSAGLVLLGTLLLAQVAWRPTLEARGFTHLAAGWIALWLVFWIATRGERHRRFLLILLVLLGAVEALYGLLQSIGGIDSIGSYYRNQGRIATGSLINRNHYAALLNMAIPLALGLLFTGHARERLSGRPRSESLAKTWLVLLGCSFMGLAVLLSQSRAGTVSLLTTLLFLAVLLVLSRRRISRHRISGAAAGLLLCLVAAMGSVLGIEALLERFGRLEEGLSRVAVYRDTLGMIADQPLVGVGPGMFRWRFRPYQSTTAQSLYDHAHNDYLETAAEWGIPLALLAWGFVFWRFYRAADVVLRSRDPRRQGLALGCAGALFSVLVHSLVDFNLQIPALLMIFGSILGLAWSLELSRESLGIAGQGSGPSANGGSGQAVAAGFGGRGAEIALRALLIVALALASWRVLERSRAAEAARPRRGLSGLERAIQIDPQAPEPRYLLGMAYRDIPGTGDLEGALALLEAAVRRNPYAWRYRLELARAQELGGELARAESSLRQAVDLNPRSGEYRWRLANFRLRHGSVTEALREISEAVQMDPQLAEPAVSLLLKGGVEAEVIDSLLPSDRSARLRLLRSLAHGSGLPGVSTAAAAEVEPVRVELLDSLWEQLLRDGPPPSLEQARPYLEQLLRSRRLADLRRTWIELFRHRGIDSREFAAGRNRVWNGDFELPPADSPLGWQLGRSDGFDARRVEGEGVDGTAALRVDFDGSENLSFAHLKQQLIVEPGASYRLKVSMRTEEITTEEGLFFEVLAAETGELLAATEPLTGTNDWVLCQTGFTAPQDDGLVRLRLRRRPSRQLDNKIRGRVWVDSMIVEPPGR